MWVVGGVLACAVVHTASRTGLTIGARSHGVDVAYTRYADIDSNASPSRLNESVIVTVNGDHGYVSLLHKRLP